VSRVAPGLIIDAAKKIQLILVFVELDYLQGHGIFAGCNLNFNWIILFSNDRDVI